MPVVFLCHNCRSRLKVGRKKIGTEVECPRCREPLLVPAAETASAGAAMAAPEGPRTPEDLFPEFAVFDDPLPPPSVPQSRRAGKRGDAAQSSTKSNGESSPELLTAPPPLSGKRTQERREQRGKEDKPRHSEPGTRLSRGESPLPTPTPAKESTRRAGAAPRHALGVLKRSDQPSSYGEVLLIRRRTLYFQALLICLMAGMGLTAGFLIGRGLGPVARTIVSAEPDLQIVGTLTYRNARGEETPDFGAVVIALPAEIPANKQGTIAAAGLSPQMARDAGRIAEMAVEELGGKYERTDGLGNFLLKLPKIGQYRLLLISRNSPRPAGQVVSAAQLKELQRYFTAPSELIGANRFAWTLRDVRDPRLAVMHSF